MAEGRYFRLQYADGTEFLLDRQGTEIWANWPEPLTLEDTATYLLGPVLGFVLRLRGTTCLHASSIAVGDRAIALLGPAGAGKSTTAASFAQVGYSILSEDVVALVDCQDHFLVQPGYPLIRLWPESVAALFGNDDALPRLTPTWDKRRFDLVGEAPRFQSEPLPLAAIYYLDERSSDPQAPYIEPFPDSQKLMTLIANTYVNYLLDERMRASEFDILGRLCKNVPVRRIVPHSEFSSLARLREVILDDLHCNVPRKEKGVSA